MSENEIGLLFLGKFVIIILFLVLIRRNKKIKEDKSFQAIERIQIKEYGRKINEKTRAKQKNNGKNFSLF